VFIKEWQELAVMPQVNVDVSDAQFEEWTEWVNEEETPHNTKSDLIRTAVNDYISEDSVTNRDLDEVDQVLSILEKIQRDVNNVADAVEKAHKEQIDGEQLDDSIDANVRRLLYKVLVGNDAVEGISLKED